MPETVIKVENLSKIYRVGQWGTGTISHDLNRWWKTKIQKKEDPYSKVGHTNDRTQKAKKDEFVYALHDINFEVKQGEVLGIIGKNGAGKSTLLKVLSRITAPTTGNALIKGRVASLLEVGTGFHPEMTGRENIFLNGTIHGMTRHEVSCKLDEIVDFAGVAKYLDTPVKRFSSGMTVRLGFAVAAFLEPEILIVDEVLAVGDAEFQKKAIGKMQDVSKGQGRTVLFVSHNMTAVQSLCNSCILIESGTTKLTDDTKKVVDLYLKNNTIELLNYVGDKHSENNVGIHLKKLKIFDSKRPDETKFDVRTELSIEIEFLCKHNSLINLSVHLYNIRGEKVFNLVSNSIQANTNNTFTGKFTIPSNFLNDGFYYLNMMFVKERSILLLEKKEILKFQISDYREECAWHGEWSGAIRPTFIPFNLTVSS